MEATQLKRATWRLLGCGVMLGSSAVQAAPFTNGSFETMTYVSPNGPCTLVQKGQTFITGWGPDAGGVTVCSSYWQNSDGIRSVELYGEGGIGALLQAFDTVPGATYKVLFALAGNPGLAGGVQGPAFAVRASAGNDYLDYNFNTTGKSLANMGWIAETFTFTALAATTTLRFDALINTPGAVTYPVIDNVRVSAVPEPSAWLLLGSGLFGLIGWRKLRHSAV